MDAEPAAGAPGSLEDRRNMQVDNAIRAIREKKPVPEIDFSIHVMEDGTPVNTQERVCKGECQPARPKLAALESTSAHAVFFPPRQMFKLPPCSSRRMSSSGRTSPIRSQI